MVGWLELIFGSMYCGKSEELIRRLKRCEYAGQKYILFKPSIDNRYDLSRVFTHESNKIKQFIVKTLAETKYDVSEGSVLRSVINNIPGSIDAVSISKPSEILDYIKDYNYDVVGIDEVQFFDANLIPVIDELVLQGKRVVVSGLDMYASGEPWGIIPTLACKAKFVDKLHAVCVDCGNEAYLSYKTDNDQDNVTSKVDVGSVGKYVALCQTCVEKRKGRGK